MAKREQTMTNGQATISLGGQDHPVHLPGFAEREDLVIAWQREEARPRRQIWALCAALGLAVPGLQAPGIKAYEATDYSPAAYGRQVYNSLMGRGLPREEIISTAITVITIVCESLFPRQEEVTSKEVFTEAAEAAPT